MKVFLLEHPRQIEPDRCNDIANTPLASSLITGCIAGMLNSMGHDIKIAEGFLDNLTYEDVAQQILEFAPPVLGVHLIYNWENNRQLFSFLKRLKEDGLVEKIVGYGYYPTFAYQEILQLCPQFDGLIIGEPEQTFAEWLETGVPVSGMACVDAAGQIQMQRREAYRNLDALPDPIRTAAMMKIGEVNIEGSRGCYGRCTFCYINPYYGEGSCWRAKSPERVMQEIDRIIAQYGPLKFYFTDPNFFGPGKAGQERAMKLAGLLKERKIRFGIEARVNDIHEDSIAALVEAGLEDLLIGLESGRDDSLRRLNKMTTVEQNESALRILRSHGIEPNVGFIMFEPDSTLVDIRTNFEFLKRNSLLKNIFITANVLYHPQIILQGTKAYRDLQQEKRLILRGTTYEGMTTFLVPEVARLAEIIGQITNYFFVRMDDIWKGKLQEPSDVGSIYQAVNQLLVNCFEENLSRLEAGEPMDGAAVSALIDKVNNKIKAIFDQFPKTSGINNKFVVDQN
ncbi:Fe-S oxidoreductase [Desulfosporosinus orientis DSM 765]|uniref:Fe-S oxidoreductase n=1 Tax=Desulfosporosinus orientis (strain ATCC 19365 / DSM 765 / NCIMB 8382 / VKM B-1628 / Singapore I) TaxID=768706 RepID=G7WGH5_DESOD|nr:radical SAM protein [Desulfosporosinus orientis]AET68052.1 Fe-S oxidoreductase [Desulfosporosinus orientis DSM 765]